MACHVVGLYSDINSPLNGPVSVSFPDFVEMFQQLDIAGGILEKGKLGMSVNQVAELHSDEADELAASV